jgi:hypothetical protein
MHAIAGSALPRYGISHRFIEKGVKEMQGHPNCKPGKLIGAQDSGWYNQPKGGPDGEEAADQAGIDVDHSEVPRAQGA